METIAVSRSRSGAYAAGYQAGFSRTCYAQGLSELPASYTAPDRRRWTLGYGNGVQHAIYGDPFKFNVAALIAIAIGIFLGLATAQAAEPFNWDRYHARQDACREHDELLWRCSSIGALGDHDWCNTALRQTDRECSAFSPLGSHPRDWQ